MADMGDVDRALKFCKQAARLEPNLPDPYINALAFAGDKKATLDSDISAWATSNLLGRDWTIDTAEYHLRAHEHLKDQTAKFAAQNKTADVQKLKAVLDNEARRDLVIELLWTGPADLDLKVREPIGSICSSLQRQTAAGGILLCDDFSQKEDKRSEVYTASEAYTGSYYIMVDRVWGRPLGQKAKIVVTKHKGTPRQTVELFTLDLTKQTSLSISLDSGQRTTLASVLPPGVPIDSTRKPEREQEVMNKLRAMTSGTLNSFGGGASSTNRDVGAEEGDAPLVDVSLQSSITSMVPGGMQFRQETTVSKDGRKMQVRMAPVFSAVPKQAKLKLDFIPGAE
jgi:hypothetical protein